METEGIFESAIRDAGDLAGVFEYDNGTAYFYLYRSGKDPKVLGAIHISSGVARFGSNDVLIRWSREMDKVGLFINGHLWAAFEADNATPYGGNYRPDASPNFPKDADEWFK